MKGGLLGKLAISFAASAYLLCSSPLEEFISTQPWQTVTSAFVSTAHASTPPNYRYSDEEIADVDLDRVGLEGNLQKFYHELNHYVRVSINEKSDKRKLKRLMQNKKNILRTLRSQNTKNLLDLIEKDRKINTWDFDEIKEIIRFAKKLSAEDYKKAAELSENPIHSLNTLSSLLKIDPGLKKTSKLVELLGEPVYDLRGLSSLLKRDPNLKETTKIIQVLGSKFYGLGVNRPDLLKKDPDLKETSKLLQHARDYGFDESRLNPVWLEYLETLAEKEAEFKTEEAKKDFKDLAKLLYVPHTAINSRTIELYFERRKEGAFSEDARNKFKKLHEKMEKFLPLFAENAYLMNYPGRLLEIYEKIKDVDFSKEKYRAAKERFIDELGEKRINENWLVRFVEAVEENKLEEFISGYALDSRLTPKSGLTEKYEARFFKHSKEEQIQKAHLGKYKFAFPYYDRATFNSIVAFRELAKEYFANHLNQDAKESRTLQILYPAGGSHVAPLEIALEGFKTDKVDDVYFTYTEIDKRSLTDLEKDLQKLVEEGLFSSMNKVETPNIEQGSETYFELIHTTSSGERKFVSINFALNRSGSEYYRQSHFDGIDIFVHHDSVDSRRALKNYLTSNLKSNNKKKPVLFIEDDRSESHSTMWCIPHLRKEVVKEQYGCRRDDWENPGQEDHLGIAHHGSVLIVTPEQAFFTKYNTKRKIIRLIEKVGGECKPEMYAKLE